MNALQISTIRPGLLVHLNTSITGNVNYSANIIEPEHVLDNGMTTKAVTETTKIVQDKAEHERAIQVRGKCRSLITSLCTKSKAFTMCPADRRDDLERAIAEARQLANVFNSTSSLTQINVYVVLGEVASNDAEAIRSINAETRRLIEDMKEGIASLDIEKIRAAANEAKDIGRMLSPAAKTRIQEAIDAARVAARAIKKAGETGAVEIDRATMFKLESARTSFLDLTDQTEIAEPTHTGRSLDLTEESQGVPAPEMPARSYELADTF